ncbi:hypothetical protein [Sphingorhabdus contaminans]|uniref:hypothetical protein n=1 Tax=Sphingorhabdus contaminans TaxID=1343899 RepID=UPI003D2E6FB6
MTCDVGPMRSFATIISLFLLLRCNEQIDESYSTYSEAQRAGAVERGWIPSFVPTSARNLKDTHDLDTSRQTLRFTIPSSAVADMVLGFRAISTEDKTAASELIDQHALAATSKVYVICSEYRNGALAVDAENGHVVFSTTVNWVDDDCR